LSCLCPASFAGRSSAIGFVVQVRCFDLRRQVRCFDLRHVPGEREMGRCSHTTATTDQHQKSRCTPAHLLVVLVHNRLLLFYVVLCLLLLTYGLVRCGEAAEGGQGARVAG
jgi:hypothetical protein